MTEKTTLPAAEFAAAESHPARLRDGRPNVRVVLDTSVLISALISGEGAPARLIDAWVDGRFKLISSEDQLEEFKVMSRRPQLAPFIERADAGRLANQLRAEALIIEKLPLWIAHRVRPIISFWRWQRRARPTTSSPATAAVYLP